MSDHKSRTGSEDPTVVHDRKVKATGTRTTVRKADDGTYAVSCEHNTTVKPAPTKQGEAIALAKAPAEWCKKCKAPPPAKATR